MPAWSAGRCPVARIAGAHGLRNAIKRVYSAYSLYHFNGYNHQILPSVFSFISMVLISYHQQTTSIGRVFDNLDYFAQTELQLWHWLYFNMSIYFNHITILLNHIFQSYNYTITIFQSYFIGQNLSSNDDKKWNIQVGCGCRWPCCAGGGRWWQSIDMFLSRPCTWYTYVHTYIHTYD